MYNTNTNNLNLPEYITGKVNASVHEKIARVIYAKTGKFIIFKSYENQSEESKPITSNKESNQMALIATFMRNLLDMGFTISQELYNNLSTLSEEELTSILPMYLDIVKSNIGADKTYKVFYPGFPSQVMALSDMALFINAYLHYMGIIDESLDIYKPNADKLYKDTNMNNISNDIYNARKQKNVINYAEPYELCKLYMNILQSPISIDDVDKYYLNLIMDYDNDSFLPIDNIPSKEVTAYYASLILKKRNYNLSSLNPSWIKTPTDVLRLYVALSNGDITLSRPTRFKNLNNKGKEVIIRLMAKVTTKDTAYMYKKYAEPWKRIIERIHPNSEKWAHIPNIKNVYDFACMPLYTKNWSDINLSFESQLEKVIINRDFNGIISLFNTHKNFSVFARHLEHFYRLFWNHESDIVNETEECKEVCDYFNTVATHVPTQILIQMYNHFKIEQNSPENDDRIFFLKSDETTKLWKRTETDRKKLPNEVYERFISIIKHALNKSYNKIDTKKFKNNNDHLGLYYIDPVMYNFTAPLVSRSKTFGNKNIAKGSHFKLDDDDKFIRPFIWWTNDKEGHRTDLDLAVEFIKENDDLTYESVAYVSYTNLKIQKRLEKSESDIDTIAVHSGDIIDGGPIFGKGVSEFVEINIDAAVKAGMRYAVICCFLYTIENNEKQSFAKTNCFMGYTTGKCQKDIVNYNPEEVEKTFSISSNTTKSIPMIIDLVERKVIWCDMNLGSTDIHYNSLMNSKMDIITALKCAIRDTNKISMGEILELHANREKGYIPVADRKYADTSFGLEEGDISPYEMDKFIAEYI